MRKLAVVLLLLVVAAIGLYIGAGYAAGPEIRIVSPERYMGQSTQVEVVVESPSGVSSLEMAFEQHDTRTPLAATDPGALARTIDRTTVPNLQSGPARIVVTATRPVLGGIRHVTSEVAHDIEVRLEPPRLSVLSTHHYVNQGGAEMIVYRVEPQDVESGVVVGDFEYPGYPASGLAVEGIRVADPAVHVAFFALLHDQPVDVPMQLYARDPAGNVASAEFDHRTFAKPVRTGRINLDDGFLERVVPAILATTPDFTPEGSTLDRYLALNGELRRRNAEQIASFAGETVPDMLWQGTVFHPFTNSQVESAFAVRRTYVYDGREVDRQTHLGFDLASYAGTPIVAAHRGRVLFAGDLGIYGRTVILDHGMGLQSLYAHLSVIEVQPGMLVEKEQPLGRSGMTGMAGGDHLHFTMLLQGRMISPLEFWDAHWIEDRVLRKLRQAQ